MKRDYLAWASLAAALAVTASAEYHLALAAGFGPWMSAGVPAALDIYAVRALRVGKDVAAVVVAMIAVNAASHLVSAGLVPMSIPLVVAVSAIAPLVMWRVHRLAKVQPTEKEPEQGVSSRPTPAPVEPARTRPVVVPAGVRLLPITARPAAVPDVTLERQDAADAGQDAPRTRELEASAPRLLTSGEAAERLGVSPSTLRNWLHDGRLSSVDRDARGRHLFDPNHLGGGRP